MSETNENKLVPKLRFPEFRDVWNPEQLSNILDYERPDNYIVKDTNYLNEGTPVLTANKSFILGYTKETNGICNDIPAIIFDDFTVDKKYVDFPFKVKSSAIKILRPKEKDDLKFIFELMSLIRFEAKEHKRYYISTYQNLTVPVPKPKEQQKIADCLSSLDKVLTAESQKLEVLKVHKKGLLQNLFPQAGETVPKFRFKEFEDSGEWEEKTLEKFCLNISSGKDKNFIGGEYELYGSTGVIGKAENASYEGDFILVARVGANAGLLNKVKGKFGVTDNTLVIDLIKKDLISFIFYTLERVGLNKLAFGSGQPLITGRQLKSLLLSIPNSEQEQQKISETLSSLDDLINAQSQKVETLKIHKKGLLRGLFPKISD